MGEHKLWVIYKDLYDFITEQTRKVNIQKKTKPYDFFLKIGFFCIPSEFISKWEKG